ncbi:MAG: hypothetical protein PHC88_08280 [Terrimicrobiaceae bacterium]|nr:hypothetical protein [Terrimicrobiaceae bacterium]
MKILRGLLCCGLAALPLAARADLLSDLSADDRAKVKAGEQVMATEPLDGYPWPRLRVYQVVAATPREVMAVFFDYDNACHYVPNCLKSQISKEIDPRSYEVDYVVDVPILPDEAYTARNELSAGPNGGLTVRWKVLRATSIEESEGSLTVEPLGEGAVLRYTNLVKPASRAAFLLKGMALSQMKDTVRALVAQTLAQKRNPQEMKRQLDRLDRALDGARN